MTDCIIKICGIRSAALAKEAVIAGANFIGMIFHPQSRRYVKPEDAKLISRTVKEAGGMPVAIFVDHDANEMRRICDIADIQIVQLHGKIARSSHASLPKHYQRIYAQAIPEMNELIRLDEQRDFILIDHSDPGKGKCIAWEKLDYDLPFRWLLAGGLNAVNVQAAFSLLQPDGVDVSTGVEDESGDKNILLIREFVNELRQ